MNANVSPCQLPARPSVRVAGAATLADGERRAFQAGGRSYLIVREGERRYACANQCIHLGVKLSGGHLTGSVLECRWHHWRFDLRTGAVDADESPFSTFETYDVTVDGDDLVIAGIPKTALRRRPEATGITTVSNSPAGNETRSRST